MWWILGRYSTRIPLAHHQFCPKFCILMNFWTTSTMHYWVVGSRSSFQGTIQNLKICKPFCVRDWWLFHQQRQMFPWWIFTISCIHSMDLIWLFGYQLCRNVEHMCQCEIFCILDGMLFVCVIPPMNTDACHVEDINIPHIEECLSLSFDASFEDWSNIFRTRSFTLCKNDLDSNGISDSASV